MVTEVALKRTAFRASQIVCTECIMAATHHAAESCSAAVYMSTTKWAKQGGWSAEA